MWSPLKPSWTKPAEKQLKKLPADVRSSVEASVNRYAATGIGRVKALQGQHGMFRLRVGDYRVRFTIVIKASEMLIIAVANRREAYD